ncbi:uncharacterized protein [Anabrus simplex]|uniref:uncharacterized protein isoform X2 n=1 Tax=Anabrus simplex TaxID=316456 RepID=UPI0035A323EA
MVLDEIQPLKMEVDENMLHENIEDNLTSVEGIQNTVAVKTEIKLEDHDTSTGEHTVQEENSKLKTILTTLEKSMEENSTQIRNYSHKEDGSSGSYTVDPIFEEDENTQASEEGSEDDITCILGKMLKKYCKTNIKCQNMLFALAYTYHPKDTAILQGIITSGKELAYAIRLMANTVQILAVAERMKSKAAIIRTRIELAKAKREGSVGIGDDIACVFENMSKTCYKTNTECQGTLLAQADTLLTQDSATLQDIITSGKELASAIRLMTNTVQILAAAERMESKTAIVRTRIELAKAKREGIEIK